MWTHRTPYIPSNLTVESIERHGRMSLYRALHLKRVVAFIGSGVSVPYGGPIWQEFAVAMIGEVAKALKDVPDPPPPQLLDIRAQLETLLAAERDSENPLTLTVDSIGLVKDQLSTILALCENALNAIDQLPVQQNAHARKRLNARKGLAGMVSSGPLENAVRTIQNTLKKFGKVDQKDSVIENLNGLLVELTNELPTVSLQNLNVDILNLYFNMIKNHDYSLDIISTSKDIVENNTDIIQSIESIGIKKYTTLNYDVTLERRFSHLSGINTDYESPQFAELLRKNQNSYNLDKINSDVYSGPWGRDAIRSTNLSKKTVGQLFNFAIEEPLLGRHVFHIHGRYDDPESMLITEDDYKRQYVSDGGSSGVLGEVMRVLFSGNDVLFIGVGLSEDDVLGPLRQVLTRDQSSDADARQTIALMPARIPSLKAGITAEDREKALEEANRKDALFTAQQKIKYGINIIRFGKTNSAYNELLSIIEFSMAAIKPNEVNRVAMEWCKNQLEDRCSSGQSKISDRYIDIIADNELEAIRFIFSEQLDLKSTRLLAIEILEILMKRLRSRALTAELQSIRRNTERWWDDWRRLPRERRPQFHVWSTKEVPYPIWIRHCPEFNSDIRQSATFLKAVMLGQEQAGKIVSGSRSRTRTLRLSIPRGGGKGALLRTLFKPLNHKQLFGHTDYDGAFFAYTSFSMEFSSVIGAMSRFLARVIAGRLGVNQDEWERDPKLALQDGGVLGHKRAALDLSRLELLRGLLAHYSSIADRKASASKNDRQPRVLICLGGLDRLCNQNGDAHNPLHRAFFRLLAGSGETLPGGGPRNPPIDLVLIASKRDMPIAYLSEESPSDSIIPAERHRVSQRSETRRMLRKWDELPRIEWKYRCKLTPYEYEMNSCSQRAQEILIKKLCLDEDKSFDPYRAIRVEIWNSIALNCWALVNFVEKVKQKNSSGDRNIEELADDWLKRMNRSAEKGHATGVIGEIFEIYEEIDRSKASPLENQLSQSIIEHFVLFVVPIDVSVVWEFPDVKKIVKNLSDEERLVEINKVIKKLSQRGFLIDLKAGGEIEESDNLAKGRFSRYVLHDQIREFIANRIKLIVPDGGDRNHFQVSIYCEQPRDTPTPSLVHFRRVSDMIQQQVSGCRTVLNAFYIIDYCVKKTQINEIDCKRLDAALDILQKNFWSKTNVDFLGQYGMLHAIPQRLRACYALLRGGFSIGALSRLSGEDINPSDARPFDIYRGLLRKLINAAVGLHYVEPFTRCLVRGGLRSEEYPPKHLKLEHWNALGKLKDRLSQQPDISDFSKKITDKINNISSEFMMLSTRNMKHPYYVDEIAWLLNERGLASFVQGRTYDAVAHYERALDWVARDPQGSEDPAYRALERRIRLNWAMAMLEQGHISKARAVLEDIRDAGAGYSKGTPSVSHLHARGYLALCDHLMGNLERARREYDIVVKCCNRTGNLRAVAIFNGHYGDLLARLGDHKAAGHRNDLARAAAAQSEQRDVYHLVLLRYAQLMLAENDVKTAIEATNQAQAYGEALGLHRIRAEALCIRAGALMNQGDARGAGLAAAEGISICNRHGLRLRRVATSILYGETLFARGEKHLAQTVLVEAKREAERIGYHVKVDQAQRILSKLDSVTPERLQDSAVGDMRAQ